MVNKKQEQVSVPEDQMQEPQSMSLKDVQLQDLAQQLAQKAVELSLVRTQLTYLGQQNQMLTKELEELKGENAAKTDKSPT